LKIRSHGCRDVGRVRESNEDFLLVDDATGLWAVADGMGGHAAGEVASELAVRALAESVRAAVDGSPLADAAAARRCLEAGLEAANRRICDSIAAHPDQRGMGTTLVTAVVVGETAVIAHVGDSRAYLLRDGQLHRLTEDHSWVNEQVRHGLLSREEAHRHPMRNVVTRALGTRGETVPEFGDAALRPGDAVLLCSDGLNVMMTDDQIRETLLPHRDDPAAACDALVRAANERGGGDNTTVIVLAVG
jgi:protein phosphatase